MADSGAPISIGMQILENGKRLAEAKGRTNLIDSFDKAIKELNKYIKAGHSTLDDRANEIIFKPFGHSNHDLEEEAMSAIDGGSSMIVPKKPEGGHNE